MASEAWSGIIEAEAGDIHRVTLCRKIGAVLTEAYPGHTWYVGWGGGSVAVMNPAISATHGFRVHPDQSASWSELRAKAIKYGGELLERASVKRGKWDGEYAQNVDVTT